VDWIKLGVAAAHRGRGPAQWAAGRSEERRIGPQAGGINWNLHRRVATVVAEQAAVRPARNCTVASAAHQPQQAAVRRPELQPSVGPLISSSRRPADRPETCTVASDSSSSSSRRPSDQPELHRRVETANQPQQAALRPTGTAPSVGQAHHPNRPAHPVGSAGRRPVGLPVRTADAGRMRASAFLRDRRTTRGSVEARTGC